MLRNTSVIYEPRGKAREYSQLAANLYRGCGHRCVYCYAPDSTHATKKDFHIPKPRENVLEKLILDSKELQRERSTALVLLCFTCDPYQQIDNDIS